MATNNIATSSSGAAQLSSNEQLYYTSKWGRVEVFNGDNYATFSTSCRFALATAGALQILEDIEKEPVDNTASNRDWKERRTIGIGIITSSVAPSYANRLLPYLANSNLQGMWNELAKANRANDEVYVANTRLSFANERFNYTRENIRQFATRLERFKIMLADSSQPITDTEMLNKILYSLPLDQPNWQMARQWAIREKHDLEKALNLFETIEIPLKPDATAAVVVDKGSSGSRLSLRNRGRGRGRGRGVFVRGKHKSLIQGDASRYHDTSRVEKPDKDECYFCRKRGHFQRDCHAYKKASEMAQRKEKNKSAHLATRSLDSTEIDDGTLYYASSLDRAYLSTSIVDWILDSGATRHFSGVLADFVTLKRWSSSRAVHIANKSTVQATGYGTVIIGSLELHDVWYVPEFKSTRLVSIMVLNDEGISVTFSGGTATGCYNKEKIFSAQRHQGLFILNGNDQAYLSITETEGLQASGVELWHQRLAHTNYRDILKLAPASKGVVVAPRISVYGEHACESCLAGKMKESFVKKTDSRTEVRLRKLHADISGILPPSLRGYRYFLLVVDDATRCAWVRFMRTKETAEILPLIMQLKTELEKETGNDIAFFRVDNGRGEFGSEFKETMRALGVQVEPSPPYKHSLNGVVERLMGTVAVRARSMLYQAGLSTDFWCLAVEHAVFIRNRAPTAALPFGSNEMAEAITPFEAYKGGYPDLTRLRVFGCAAYPINTREKFPSKFESRSKQGYIFVGMKGSSIWKLLNCKTFKIEHYADAKFDESMFPAPKFEKQPIIADLPAMITLNKTDEKSAGSKTELEPRPTDVSTTKEEQIRPLSRRHRTAREKHWEYYPKVEGFVERPVELTQSRTRQNKDQAKATISTRPHEATVQPSTQLSVDTEVAPRDVTMIPHQQLSYKVDGSKQLQAKMNQVFSHAVVQSVIVYNAVHLETEESSSLGVPAAPFEAITVAEAMQEDAPGWKAAINAELKALVDMNTFKVMRGDKQKVKVISSRWVLRKKFRADGSIARKKARLVIRGFEQTYGIDYFATFASVAKYTTLRMLLAKAAADNLEADHVDVNTAFLNPILEEDVYMEIPEFFEMIYPELKDKENIYLKLSKALYGLKQAPRAWQKMVHAFLESVGFRPSQADPSLYIGRDRVFILLFVDDMLIIGKRSQVDTIKAQILEQWKSKDLGPVDTFVGFQIQRNRQKRSLHIHQTLYITKLLNRLSMNKANPCYLPISAGTVLKPDKKNLLNRDETGLYRQIVGSAIYLANNTRPDISYAVGQLARFMATPAVIHIQHAKQLLRYLNGTRTIGITYSNRLREGLHTYKLFSDATWGSEDDRISFQGWAVLRYGGVVSWSAQRQKSTALSSMEAEIVAASEGAKEAAWLEKLLVDFGERHNDGCEAFIPILYCDNHGAIDLMHDPKFHARAKHIDLRNMYIRNDMVSQKRMRVKHIPGANQPADMLTKQLPISTFTRHIATFGMEKWGNREIHGDIRGTLVP